MEKDLHNDHIVSKNKDSYAFIHRYIIKKTININKLLAKN